MYAPTACQPAAMPTRACYARPALYHYAPAPYLSRRRYGQGRSMVAACANAGFSMATAQAWLNRQGANAVAGLPVNWPS